MVYAWIHTTSISLQQIQIMPIIQILFALIYATRMIEIKFQFQSVLPHHSSCSIKWCTLPQSVTTDNTCDFSNGFSEIEVITRKTNLTSCRSNTYICAWSKSWPAGKVHCQRHLHAYVLVRPHLQAWNCFIYVHQTVGTHCLVEKIYDLFRLK